ncbi:MAG TPA: hypothetical protein VFV33_18635 [Gemmatimonadaceae bacterium]|nr:hypothetical protein [Gemmatimonadaceae bacterium]
MSAATDTRPRATLSDRVAIYTSLLLCETRDVRAALEAFLVDVLHHDDLARVVSASREVSS